MNLKKLLEFVLDILFNVWLLIYVLTVICFIIALGSKIFNPEIKNLDWNNFAIFGVALILLFVINMYALKRRSKNKSE